MSREFAMNARFVTQAFTGIQRYSYELSLQLQNATLLSPGAPRIEYDGVQSRVRVTGARLRGHIWEQFALPLAAPRRQALFSPAGCGPVTHANHVVTIHDLAPLENPEWYGPAFATWYSRLLPALSRRVRRVLTVSEYCKRRIVELLNVPERKVTVAWEAAARNFAPQPADAVEEALDRLSIRTPFFLAIGAVSPRKNFPRLLAAWKRVHGRMEGHSLVVIGKTGLAFAGRAGLGEVPEAVLRVESVTDQDLARIYSAAEGLLYPSLYEGFGLPILEAMACGCPVLTSDCTAMPEVAGGAAVLVDPLSEDSIAQGIRCLSNRSRVDLLRDKGRERARQFSWRTTARVVEEAVLS